MPKGADFVCENLECKNVNMFVSIHGPFPIALIKDVMALDEIISNPSHYAVLDANVRDGREYAVIPLPNTKKLKPKGIRIQYYSPKEKIIFNKELIWGRDDETIKTILAGGDDISESSSKLVNLEVISFENLIKNGMPCPSCGFNMKAKPWFTGVGVSDWGDPNGSSCC